MKIAIVTCFHERPEVSIIFTEHFKRLREVIPDLELLAAVTKDDFANITFLIDAGARFVEVENEPLGAKWNAAFGLVKDTECRGVIVLGSDDICSAWWILLCMEEFKKFGNDYIIAKSLGLYDLRTKRAAIIEDHLDRSIRIGAGRFMSRAILEAVNFAPITPEKMKGLDGDCYRNCKPHWNRPVALKSPAGSRPPITDIKSGQNLWSYDSLVSMGSIPASKETVLWMLNKAERDSI